MATLRYGSMSRREFDDRVRNPHLYPNEDLEPLCEKWQDLPPRQVARVRLGQSILWISSGSFQGSFFKWEKVPTVWRPDEVAGVYARLSCWNVLLVAYTGLRPGLLVLCAERKENDIVLSIACSGKQLLQVEYEPQQRIFDFLIGVLQKIDGIPEYQGSELRVLCGSDAASPPLTPDLWQRSLKSRFEVEA